MRFGARTTLATVLLGWAVLVWPPAGLCLGEGDDGAAPPSLPDDRLGIRMAPLLLFSRQDIREDVGLDAQQTADVERAIVELRARAAATRGLAGPALAAARRDTDAAMRLWLETHLAPEQLTRLVQIDLQWEGPSAFITRPVVADSLGLSGTQREAVKKAVDDCRAKRASGAFQMSDQHRLVQQTHDLLTEEQRVRWKEMRGRPMRLFTRLAQAAEHAAPK